MSFFKSLVKVFNKPTEGFSGDLFSHRPIEIFLNAREHLTYFNSLRGVDAERNFHEQLKNSILPLLEFLDSPEHRVLINSILFKEGSAKHIRPDANVASFLKKIDSEGFKILELNKDVTFESLKKAYKAAAKKHHPDLGGDENKMKIVNNAYTKFHDILCSGDSKRFSDSDAFSDSVSVEDRECSSANDVIYLAAVALVKSLVDLWAVDEAITILKKFEKFESLAPYQDLSIMDTYYLANSLLKGAERLHYINQTDAARWLISDFEIVFTEAKRLDPFIIDRRKHVRSGFGEKSSLKIVIKHPLQGENLHRLKAIDDKRFAAYVKKAGTAQNKSSELSEKTNDIITNGFINLDFDKSYKCEGKTRPLIPVPSYNQTRVNHLNNEQIGEYFCAFSPKSSSELLSKYITVRLHSYLMSIIFFYDKDALPKIKQELKSLHDLKIVNNFTVIDLQKIIRHLENLSDSDRSKKLRYCQRVDDPTPGANRSMTAFITADPSDRNEKNAIDVSSSYLFFLERIDSNGNLTENNSSRWSEDLALIQELGQSPAGKSAQEASSESDKPEKIIQAVSEYLEAIIALSTKIDPLNVGQLQLGYWVDALTVAFGKQRNWYEVNRWLDWFFALQSSYFERLNNGDREKMQKRFDRAKKELKKAA